MLFLNTNVITWSGKYVNPLDFISGSASFGINSSKRYGRYRLDLHPGLEEWRTTTLIIPWWSGVNRPLVVMLQHLNRVKFQLVGVLFFSP